VASRTGKDALRKLINTLTLIFYIYIFSILEPGGVPEILGVTRYIAFDVNFNGS
jgi:hypothetical protein